MSSIGKTILTFKDTVSSISFSKDSSVASSSWDGSLSLTNRNMENFVYTFRDEESDSPKPVIHSIFAFGSISQIVALSLENDFSVTSFPSTKTNIIPLPIQTPLFKIIQFPEMQSCFILPDRNKTIYSIDIREKDKVTSKITLEKKFNDVTCSNFSLVAVDTEKIFLFDIRNMKSPQTTLNHVNIGEVTSVEYIENESVICGGAEGRICVNYLDEKANKNYSFKCHRTEVEGKAFIFSVNTLAYDKKRRLLYSGGSDGHLCGWDYVKRKRVFKSPKEDLPVNHIILNDDNSTLVYSTSELYEDGNFAKPKVDNFVKIVPNIDRMLSKKQ